MPGLFIIFVNMEKNRSISRDLWKSLREKLRESLISVVPVSLLVFLLAVTPWVDITKQEPPGPRPC